MNKYPWRVWFIIILSGVLFVVFNHTEPQSFERDYVVIGLALLWLGLPFPTSQDS